MNVATSKPWLAAAFTWSVAILALGSIRVNDPSWQPLFAGADKVTHAVIYAIAAYFWRRSFRSQGRATTWLVVAGVAALGVVDEWHQRSVPGRSADVFDWVADTLGALAGTLVWRRLHARKTVSA